MQLIAEMVDEIMEEYEDAEKYAKKMMQVYNWEHKKMIDHVARVKALLATVKA